MGRLAGKVALVMGGGADGPPARGETLPIGIGRAIAIQCGREGASVVVADRNLASAEETAQAIRDEGGEAHAVACDVLEAAQCAAAVAAAVERFGALHLLVNNVATADMAPITQASDEEFDLVQRVNVRGQYFGIKAAMPAIERAGGGAIVNVSSLNALRVGDGAGVSYVTSKAALIGLTRSVAYTAAPLNIRVNAVLPGLIDSTMLRRYVGDAEIDFTAGIPCRRMGTPWDVAKAVTFLLSDDASYIMGTELLVDGGVTSAL
jgi:NAD(P)-dependent dehydrogenase (short-subunit alcohol dehydrogenase family)